MCQRLSFSFFLNQFFNENMEKLLILMENVSQKNIRNGKKPTPPWSPPAPSKAASIHHKNIISLRQICSLAILLHFLFSVWITQSSRRNVLMMVLSQIN